MEVIDFIEPLSYAWLGVCGLYFFLRSDEIPLIISLFFFQSGLYRYNYVVSSDANWVRVAYSIRDFFEMNLELAHVALQLFFMGTLLLSGCYMLFREMVGKPKYFKDNQKALKRFVTKNQNYLYISSAIVYIISNFFVVGYTSGYLYLLEFAHASHIVLLFILFRSTPKSNLGKRVIILVVMAILAESTIGTVGRFRFAAWVIGLGMIIVGDRPAIVKAQFYAVGGIALVLLFSLMGVFRMKGDMPMEERLEASLNRFEKAEDANMLDGFMMLLQVYPQHLDFQYGMKHLQILLRPIPRGLWPGKPVGGYQNKLGLSEGATQTGISPSLYGSFYAEGYIPGIIILCLLYALLFAFFMRFVESFRSDLKFALKGAFFGSLIVYLRGGDLPGIVAFMGMAFWPMAIFVYRYLPYAARAVSRERAKKKLKLLLLLGVLSESKPEEKPGPSSVNP